MPKYMKKSFQTGPLRVGTFQRGPLRIFLGPPKTTARGYNTFREMYLSENSSPYSKIGRRKRGCKVGSLLRIWHKSYSLYILQNNWRTGFWGLIIGVLIQCIKVWLYGVWFKAKRCIYKRFDTMYQVLAIGVMIQGIKVRL